MDDGFSYSFKARKGVVNDKEMANRVLIEQVIFGYPLILFSEKADAWKCEGFFRVNRVEDHFIMMEPYRSDKLLEIDLLGSVDYMEGGRRLAVNLLVERNSKSVSDLKKLREWICDICSLVSHKRYGVGFIEAHHKTPVHFKNFSQKVEMEDFALLCPNCHTAIHILMISGLDEYSVLRRNIRQSLRASDLNRLT